MAALDDEGISGSDYLEKIVQVEHRLPEASPDRLTAMLQEELDRALKDVPQDRLDAERWVAVHDEIVRPLVDTPRHIRRYVNAVPLAVDVAGDEVDVVDVLALTAAQILLPDFHARLPELRDDLAPSGRPLAKLLRPNFDEEQKAKLMDVAQSSERPAVVEAMFHLLWPLTDQALRRASYSGDELNRWKRDRRVAVSDRLDTYLTATLPEGTMSVSELRDIVDAFNDPQRLREQLARRDPVSLAGLLSRLSPYIDDLSPEQATTAIPVLEEQMPRLYGEDSGLLSPSWRTRSFISALLCRGRPEDRLDVVQARFRDAPTLTHRLTVLEYAAGRDANHELVVPEAEYNRLQEALVDLALGSAPSALAAEAQAIRLVALVVEMRVSTDADGIRTMLQDDVLFLHYVATHIEWQPGFPDEVRHVFHWRNAAAQLGADWLKARIAAFDVDPSDPTLAERLRLARAAAAMQAA